MRPQMGENCVKDTKEEVCERIVCFSSDAVAHTFMEWIAQPLQSGTSTESPENMRRVVGQSCS